MIRFMVSLPTTPVLCCVAILSWSVHGLDNGLSLTPAMGWNSWIGFGCNGDNMTGSITAQIVTQTADALVSSGLKDKGYTYVNLDDCWLTKDRDANGDLQVDPRAFPDGLAPVIEHVHGLGLKFGLYLSCGNRTCQGRAGSWGHEEQDARYLAKLGVDYLKYDNCGVSEGATWSNPTSAYGVQTRYARMGVALNKTARPIVYSICCPYDPQFVASKGYWVGQPNASQGGGNSWRIGCDMPGADFGIVLIVADVAASWGKHSVTDYAAGRPQIGPGKWVDPDAFNLGNGGMTEAEERTYFSLWCLLKAPLLMGNDVRNMSAQTLAIYGAAEVVAVDQTWGGAIGYRVSSPLSSLGHVWAAPNLNGRWDVLAFNDDGSKHKNVTVLFTDLGMGDSQVASVRDLWARKELGKFTGKFTAHNLLPHGSMMLAVTPHIDQPAAAVSAAKLHDSGAMPTPAVRYVHKKTYGTGDPLAAAQFVVDHLGASGPGVNSHKCGATHSVTFKGTASDKSGGDDFQMHFVFNPHKPPGKVYMNASELGLYEEHLRGASFRNNSMDQFMDNHIGLVVDSIDPFVRQWQAAKLPYVCRTWCCGPGMPQFEEQRCPRYSFNRTEGCEVGCYVEVPHGALSTEHYAFPVHP